MKTITKTGLGLLALGALGLGGCASTPPRELADARVAYQRAAKSPNAALVPGEMMDARESLKKAEDKFDADGDEPSTRDLAYVAQRRAISAAAKAEATRATADKEVALADLEQAKRQQAVATAGNLDRTKSALTQAQQQAESERQARIAADQRAQDALAKIQDLKTQQSDRGLVLTLSGGVLFATGKSVLLGTAQQKLREVAAALKTDSRPILVVGHTDSTGSDQANQKLSEQRAEAVKKYIIQQGVPENRVRSEGMGESQPIASNESPDGRANNRRVEIILENASGSGTSAAPTNAKPGGPGLNGPQVPAPQNR